MDKALRDILNNLPDKPPRSRLAPYSELIDELLHRGWTYRGIAETLMEKCGVRVSASNLHYFVKQAKTKREAIGNLQPTRPREANGTSEESGQIAVLKHQLQETQLGDSEFTFDPTVPLRIKRQGNDDA